MAKSNDRCAPSTKSRIEKIGVKPGWRVAAIAVGDQPFIAELRGVTADVTVGRAPTACHAIFLGVAREADLARMAAVKPSLAPDGALWLIRPKSPGRGKPAPVSEAAAMAAGKAAGLVDVKVVGFSETHTAEKFVIPLKARR